ncbi:MAG TPA: hypothetical protein DDW76_30775 [Cyanobacteria bacterium UBA11369]|nr:hypothetical protein [Cyanobacteria bacterium UBA11371]HBE34949.1 hypothetical protein [Cyanobacteria bacterium UBA11368]HBE53030.1 hypothetical protein [Cyanobacteria bacterium UBA11369]
MSESKTLTIQVSGEDCDRLVALAKRRQIDADTLARMLLHDSLTKLSPLLPTDIESLEKLYTFQGKTEVLQFLEKYPFLVPILLKGYEPTRKYFPDAQLFLQVVTDPEAASKDDDMLWIYIERPFDFDPETAIDTLEKLDDDWWIDAEKRAQGKLFIGFN